MKNQITPVVPFISEEQSAINAYELSPFINGHSPRHVAKDYCTC